MQAAHHAPTPGDDIDAQLYALQALVRIHPALGTDLDFQHTSQDAYSIFSPFYASVIKLVDLRNATLLLTILFIPSAFFISSCVSGPKEKAITSAR